MEVDTWEKCYPSAWKGIITPESFSHPAKFSSRLIERIYQHGIDCGWLHEGSRIVDCFGGVGLGAWPALRFGMSWSGVELESRFVTLAQANIDAWNAKYSGRLARWGTARIIQGDSRHLAQVIGAAEACISSPPYSETLLTQSPEYWQKKHDKLPDLIMPGHAKSSEDYHGSTPGNLGNLPPGDVDAVISSPPYADAVNIHGEGPSSIGERHAKPGPNEQAVKSVGMAYGQTPGQLAALPPGAFQAAISSPPFTGSMVTSDDPDYAYKFHGNQKDYGPSRYELHNEFTYMSPEWIEERRRQSEHANLSRLPIEAETVQTFWQAAREIIAQVYQVLTPGAHAIWVVKSYVKNKVLVDFPHQWQTLCESVGFVTLHEHHALLVRHGATSIDIDGNHHEKKTESKSFFRRLAEKNGSPRIDFETVLCMVKPGGAGGGWDGAISSPPFSGVTPHNGGEADFIDDKRLFGDYGSTPGQLGSLPPGSPPDNRHGEGD